MMRRFLLSSTGTKKVELRAKQVNSFAFAACFSVILPEISMALCVDEVLES